MATDLLCRAKEEAFFPSTETACPLDVEGKRLALGLQGCLLRRVPWKRRRRAPVSPQHPRPWNTNPHSPPPPPPYYTWYKPERSREWHLFRHFLDVVDLENRALSVKTELLAIPRQRPASSGGPLNRENFSSSSQVPSFFWAEERGGDRRIGKWRP